MLIPLFHAVNQPCAWVSLDADTIQAQQQLMTLRGGGPMVNIRTLTGLPRPDRAPAPEEALAAGIPTAGLDWRRLDAPRDLMAHERLALGLAFAARLLTVQRRHEEAALAMTLSLQTETGRMPLNAQLHVSLLGDLSGTPPQRTPLGDAMNQLARFGARQWQAMGDHDWISSAGCHIGLLMPGLRGQLRHGLEHLSATLRSHAQHQFNLNELTPEQQLRAETEHVVIFCDHDDDGPHMGSAPWHRVRGAHLEGTDRPGLYSFRPDSMNRNKAARHETAQLLGDTPILSGAGRQALAASSRLSRRMTERTRRRLLDWPCDPQSDPGPDDLLGGARWTA